MNYLLRWGEAPKYCYEQEFETGEEALAFLNSMDVVWNGTEGHWYKLYKSTFCATNSEWQQLKKKMCEYLDEHTLNYLVELGGCK